MSFEVVYHPQVMDDLSSINRNIQARIENAISSRLLRASTAYVMTVGRDLICVPEDARRRLPRHIIEVVRNEIWVLGNH